MYRPFFCTIVLLLSLAPATFAPDKRPDINGLCFARIQVSSLGAAETFYGNQLGLPRISECWGPLSGTCFRITPYQSVEIFQSEGPAPSSLLSEVGFWTTDADSLHAYLLARGISVGEMSSGPEGLRSFQVSDPEQHRLQFFSSKGRSHELREPPEQVSFHMIHAGFVVHDRAAEDHFYRDILGFRPYWHGGMKDGKDDWVSLQVPDGVDWIEYMLNIPLDADKKLLGVMNHIALGVRDIQAAKEKLLKNGVTLTEEPKLGRDGKWQLNLYDPDFTRVEFMEFYPKEKPCCSEFTGRHPGTP